MKASISPRKILFACLIAIFSLFTVLITIPSVINLYFAEIEYTEFMSRFPETIREIQFSSHLYVMSPSIPDEDIPVFRQKLEEYSGQELSTENKYELFIVLNDIRTQILSSQKFNSPQLNWDALYYIHLFSLWIFALLGGKRKTKEAGDKKETAPVSIRERLMLSMRKNRLVSKTNSFDLSLPGLKSAVKDSNIDDEKKSLVLNKLNVLLLADCIAVILLICATVVLFGLSSKIELNILRSIIQALLISLAYLVISQYPRKRNFEQITLELRESYNMALFVNSGEPEVTDTDTTHVSIDYYLNANKERFRQIAVSILIGLMFLVFIIDSFTPLTEIISW